MHTNHKLCAGHEVYNAPIIDLYWLGYRQKIHCQCSLHGQLVARQFSTIRLLIRCRGILRGIIEELEKVSKLVIVAALRKQSIQACVANTQLGSFVRTKQASSKTR